MGLKCDPTSHGSQASSKATRDRWHTLQGFQMGFLDRVDFKAKIEFHDLMVYNK